MKKEDLTLEEFALVQKFRQENERKAKVRNLEQEFESSLEEANSEIDKYLKIAQEAVEKAVEVSEKTGIPFNMDLSGMPGSRQYVPFTFNKKWKDLGGDFLYNYDLNVEDLSRSGWEYWNTSSLSC